MDQPEPGVLRAGQHPVPLEEVHAQMGPEELRRHLAEDHNRPVKSRKPAVVQYLHRRAHD